jgi:uncharacterized cupredoxin-like copper-binding protein
MGKIHVAAALLGLTVGLVACDSDDADGGGGVDVTLEDFTISLDEASAPAGEVTFNVENKGPSTHEFVVIQTDLAPDALPTDDTGDVSEDDLAPLDEIEDIEDGATPDLTVELEAGDYVLICNIPGHYRQGMYAAFTAT